MTETLPQFTTEVKLVLREAQLKILASREATRVSQDQTAQAESSFQKLLTQSIDTLGLKTASIDLATLTLTNQVVKEEA